MYKSCCRNRKATSDATRLGGKMLAEAVQNPAGPAAQEQAWHPASAVPNHIFQRNPPVLSCIRQGFEGGTMMSTRKVKTLPMTRAQIRNEYVQNKISMNSWQLIDKLRFQEDKDEAKDRTLQLNSQNQGFVAAAEIPMPVAPHRSSSQTASTNS